MKCFLKVLYMRRNMSAALNTQNNGIFGIIMPCPSSEKSS